MIPLLSVMVGTYIVAKMVDQIVTQTQRPGAGHAGGVSVMVAVVAIGVAIICTVAIIRRANELEQTNPAALFQIPGTTP